MTFAFSIGVLGLHYRPGDTARDDIYIYIFIFFSLSLFSLKNRRSGGGGGGGGGRRGAGGSQGIALVHRRRQRRRPGKQRTRPDAGGPHAGRTLGSHRPAAFVLRWRRPSAFGRRQIVGYGCAGRGVRDRRIAGRPYGGRRWRVL